MPLRVSSAAIFVAPSTLGYVETRFRFRDH